METVNVIRKLAQNERLSVHTYLLLLPFMTLTVFVTSSFSLMQGSMAIPTVFFIILLLLVAGITLIHAAQTLVKIAKAIRSWKLPKEEHAFVMDNSLFWSAIGYYMLGMYGAIHCQMHEDPWREGVSAQDLLMLSGIMLALIVWMTSSELRRRGLSWWKAPLFAIAQATLTAGAIFIDSFPLALSAWLGVGVGLYLVDRSRPAKST